MDAISDSCTDRAVEAEGVTIPEKGAEKHLSWLDPSNPNSLNLLRLVLATLVIFSHSWPLGLGQEAERNEPFKILTRGQVTGGEIAVTTFFIISGFLIANSWMRCRSLLDFIWKRITRIHPGYAVASLATFFIFGLLSTSDPNYLHAFSPSMIFKQIVLLMRIEPPQVFPNNPYPLTANGSMWSIRFEFWCYILVAVLGLLSILRSRWIVLSAFLVSMVQLVISPFPEAHHLEWRGYLPMPIYGSWPSLIAAFMAGVTIYSFRESVPRSKTLIAVSTALLIAACVSGVGFTIALALAGTYATFYFAFTPGSRLNGIFQKNDISYGVYLYAFPIQQTIVMLLGPTQPFILFLLALLPTFVLGALSWFLIEKPLVKLGRKSPNHGSA